MVEGVRPEQEGPVPVVVDTHRQQEDTAPVRRLELALALPLGLPLVLPFWFGIVIILQKKRSRLTLLAAPSPYRTV